MGEPGWSEALHWLISFTPVLCIPAWFCYYTCPRGVWRVTRVFSVADADDRYQTASTGLRHPSFKEEGAGKRCSECASGPVPHVSVSLTLCMVLGKGGQG